MVTLAVELPPPAADPDHVRRIVEEVLSRREFADAAPSLAARLRGWVAEQVGRLLEAVAGTGQAPLIGTLVLVAVVAVAAVLAVRFVRGLRPDPGRSATATVEGVGRDAADWAAEAEEHERAGRLRAALRCRYRALLADLAAGGVVDELPGRTSGEYLEEVRRRRPAVADHVAAVTAAFEASWYGHARVHPAMLDEVRRRTEDARAAVAGRAPALAGEQT